MVREMVPSSGIPMKVQMVTGRDAMLWAKMMGSTPDIFTFMGR